MSSAAVFELRSDVPISQVRERVLSLWDRSLGHGYQSLVSAGSSGGHNIELSWFFGDSREDKQARLVVDYLLSVSSDATLHYLRDPTVDPSDPYYSRPITVDEVFHPEFRPRMDAPIHYRYLIQKG
jgi:hypothetical protein